MPAYHKDACEAEIGYDLSSQGSNVIIENKLDESGRDVVHRDYSVTAPVQIRFAPEYLRQIPALSQKVAGEVKRLLTSLKTAMTRRQIQEQLGLRHDEHFRLSYLQPTLVAGLIEMTIPDKPTSRLQKYRLSAKGRAWLEEAGEAR